MNFQFLSKFSSLFIIGVLILSFSSCGSEPDEPNPEIPTTGGNSSNTNVDISSTVKKNVQVQVSYNNYRSHIQLKHSLPSLFPNQKIEYSIGHSTRWSSDWLVIDSNKRPITPNITTSGSTTTMKVDYPFYYYFIYMDFISTNSSDEKYYREIYTECEFYMASYDALMKKSSLSKDEKDLLKTITKELNKYESMVKGNYSVWVFVKVGNTNVSLGSYQI